MCTIFLYIQSFLSILVGFQIDPKPACPINKVRIYIYIYVLFLQY